MNFTPSINKAKGKLEHTENVLKSSFYFENASSFIKYLSNFTIEIKKNEYFIKKGNINNKLGFVKKGILRGFIMDEKGNDINLTFYKENDIVSGNLVPNIPSAENIQAIENCTVYVADFKYVMSLILKDEKLIKIFNETLGGIYSDIHSRYISLISYNALKKYRYFLKEYPDLINRIPNYYIASFLGITPTQLSRIRKEYLKTNENALGQNNLLPKL